MSMQTTDLHVQSFEPLAPPAAIIGRHPLSAKAAETVKGIQEAWVQGTKAIVREGKVTEWRVTLKVTFIVS